MTLNARLALALAGACGLLLALAILYRTPPEQSRFAPPCMFHKLTGLHCPGCGATRSAYALLHGRPADAARKNILFIAALPFIAFWAMRSTGRFVRGVPSSPSSGVLMRPRVTKAIVVAVFAFAILRNLPWPPFTLLAPQ
jgi:hypothetical protein